MDRETVDEIKKHFDAAVAETKRDSAASTETMKRHLDASVEEMKRHFGLVSEANLAQTRAVAEGLDRLSVRVDGLSSRVDGMEGEFRRQFVETQAMIRLSYSELDRRLRDLEAGHEDFERRLSRIEGR